MKFEGNDRAYVVKTHDQHLLLFGFSKYKTQPKGQKRNPRYSTICIAHDVFSLGHSVLVAFPTLFMPSTDLWAPLGTPRWDQIDITISIN